MRDKLVQGVYTQGTSTDPTIYIDKKRVLDINVYFQKQRNSPSEPRVLTSEECKRSLAWSSLSCTEPPENHIQINIALLVTNMCYRSQTS